MSYLAAMLLLALDGDECRAFVALANLLAHPLCFDFYRLERARWAPHVAAFDVFFARKLPLLARHFARAGVLSELFVVDWSLTLFSRAMPLACAARVWDSCLLHGEVFVVRAALGVLRLYAETLGAQDMEQILRFLRCLPRTLRDDALFDAIESISISERKFQDALERERVRCGGGEPSVSHHPRGAPDGAQQDPEGCPIS